MSDAPAAPRVRIRPHDVVAVFGKRGTGKSNAAKDLCAQALDQGRRVVAFDPHDEYSRHGRQSDQVRLGPLDDRVTVAELLEDPTRYLDWEALTLAVVPSEDPEDCATDFVALARLITLTGNLLFVVEEVGYFSTYCASKLDWLATQSRHHEVPCLFVAQRAVQVPKTARTQLTQLVSFRQDHPDDLKALADLAGPAFADDVSRLGRGQWKHWRDSLTAVPATEKKAKAK